ncbi:MAG TPA: TRZ/ATZ family hydrolase [Povalibacter sp.]|uniref:TRZ/ATZ family hydrolase n=1 Tax=Povalibacter sp. TaxID=1962978 RepID=UPI002C552F1F|nr:TRZ/ATZ family hydrolase [Povalibacter sp.]HMN43964.1 TRZ/ATZ family hydrolase [Povalibacter sp.]
MDPIDTLIAARWIVPVEPSGHVLEHHAIAIRQGRIIAIEPEKQARERYAARETIERPNHVLLPGLVNAHTHAAMALLRGAAESASLDHWLSAQVRPLEERWMDAEYVRDGTELAIADMLTSGTTCFADMHLFPEVIAQAASSLRMRASIGMPVLDVPTQWAGSVDEYLAKGLQLHDEYRDDPLITTSFAPHAPHVVSDATLTRVQRAADEIELPVRMQVNQSHTQTLRDGERTLARLERLGLLSPLLSAVHMVHLDEDDLDRASRAGISVIHCPQSNLKLGNGVSPIRALRARGVRIALGTNGAASNNDQSLFDEMRTAALLERGIITWQLDGSPPMTAHDWLHAATLGGAQALGLSESIGSLTPGKWADLCCVDLARPQSQPVYDPVVALVHSISREQVSDVWVAGRALLTDGRLTQIDLDALLQRAQGWQERIASTRLTEE